MEEQIYTWIALALTLGAGWLVKRKIWQAFELIAKLVEYKTNDGKYDSAEVADLYDRFRKLIGKK